MRSQYRTRVDDVAWAGRVRSAAVEQEGPPEQREVVLRTDLQRLRDFWGDGWTEQDEQEWLAMAGLAE